jgi:hypothetical protein
VLHALNASQADTPPPQGNHCAQCARLDFHSLLQAKRFAGNVILVSTKTPKDGMHACLVQPEAFVQGMELSFPPLARILKTPKSIVQNAPHNQRSVLLGTFVQIPL